MAKSDMVRGMLFGVEFITNVAKEVKKLGGTEEQIYEAMKTESNLAKNVAQFIVGTKKLALKYLTLIQDGIMIAVEAFSKSSFFSNGPKLYFWDNFKNWVLSEIPDVIPAFTGSVRKTQLTKNMYDSEIQAELGNPTAFSVSEFAAIIKGLIAKQPKGEGGDLLNNGYANIFYVQLANRTVFAVGVRCCGGDREWRFSAFSLAGDRWLDGLCVFSRS